MITAHLPAGYVLSRTRGWSGAILGVALLGAVFPDLDLIWFYGIDNRAFHHHHYWVHAPGFMLAASAALILLTRWNPLAIAFSAAWGLHILLDAPTGGLMWLLPFSDTLYTPITVEPMRSHWILSFPTHWTMLFELAIWVAAFSLFARVPDRD